LTADARALVIGPLVSAKAAIGAISIFMEVYLSTMKQGQELRLATVIITAG
jgi:hypothetical protein